MKPKRFQEIKCAVCDGEGIVGIYSNNDFEGPDECRSCDGSGRNIIYVKSGVIAKYLGGPLMGRIPPKLIKMVLEGKWTNLKDGKL